VDIAIGCFLGLLAGRLPWLGGYLVCYFVIFSSVRHLVFPRCNTFSVWLFKCSFRQVIDIFIQ